MAAKLTLRWTDRELQHRVRNFGEEAWGELSRSGLGAASIAEVDMATDHFVVDVSKRNIGPATELLRRLLKRHNLENAVQIERS